MPHLHERSDLLDLIDKAVLSGTDQERKDLLAAAALRIRAMNEEHAAMCAERGNACERAEKAEAALREHGRPAAS